MNVVRLRNPLKLLLQFVKRPDIDGIIAFVQDLYRNGWLGRRSKDWVRDISELIQTSNRANDRGWRS